MEGELYREWAAPESDPPLTRTALDRRHCGTPGCECSRLLFRVACHRTGDLTAVYHKDTGVLRLACPVCGKVVADVAVRD